MFDAHMPVRHTLCIELLLREGHGHEAETQTQTESHSLEVLTLHV